jgi:hypothetical protein
MPRMQQLCAIITSHLHRLLIIMAVLCAALAAWCIPLDRLGTHGLV